MYTEIRDDDYPPAKVFLAPGILYYDSMGEKGLAVYRSQRSFTGEGVKELKILKGRPPVESYLLHREHVDGRYIWILSDTLFEYDGRGLIVFNEYCRAFDRKYLPEGYESELCHSLNDREAVPTYVTDEAPEFTDVDFLEAAGKSIGDILGDEDVSFPVTASGTFLGEDAQGSIFCGEDGDIITKITLSGFGCSSQDLIGKCADHFGEAGTPLISGNVNGMSFGGDGFSLNVYFMDEDGPPSVEIVSEGNGDE
ncbi:MAG: hypothetical protein IK115_05325 [Lachnospiraceae bacterium]|nr:hypothetical protein [Lachnospiraceae bacterium]